MNSIILASSSPRRQELLEQLRIPFKVRAANVDESIEMDMPPEQTVQSLALRKARAVAGAVESGLVIGSDTVVVLDDRILGKPQSKEEALLMLRSLQGRTHRVFTGLAVIDAAASRSLTAYECTKVQFRQAGQQELEAYISTGEPFDKAGAYGIQGLGAVFVNKIEGCYFNVVGLPLARLVEVLDRFGVKVANFWGKKTG